MPTAPEPMGPPSILDPRRHPGMHGHAQQPSTLSGSRTGLSKVSVESPCGHRMASTRRFSALSRSCSGTSWPIGMPAAAASRLATGSAPNPEPAEKPLQRRLLHVGFTRPGPPIIRCDPGTGKASPGHARPGSPARPAPELLTCAGQTVPEPERVRRRRAEAEAAVPVSAPPTR